VFVIAEIGINHNGSVDIAKRLIDMAKEAGCDAVKFQKRTIDLVYDEAFLQSYAESPWGTTQRDLKRGLEFGEREYDEIDAYCRRVGLPWFASAWDLPSQEFLRKYDLAFNKLASAMLRHPELPEAVAREGRPTFVSTGMSTYADIDRVMSIFRKHDCPVVLMHTVSEYPARPEILNLAVIHELRTRYRCPVGYSGHEVSMVPGVYAAMLGAVAIERHITLDRAMWGVDQAASLEKRGLELLVQYIRAIPAVVGDGIKRITPGEEAKAKKLLYRRAQTEPQEAPLFGMQLALLGEER
jgi:N-acetylneuraminate synthase